MPLVETIATIAGGTTACRCRHGQISTTLTANAANCPGYGWIRNTSSTQTMARRRCLSCSAAALSCWSTTSCSARSGTKAAPGQDDGSPAEDEPA